MNCSADRESLGKGKNSPYRKAEISNVGNDQDRAGSSSHARTPVESRNADVVTEGERSRGDLNVSSNRKASASPSKQAVAKPYTDARSPLITVAQVQDPSIGEEAPTTLVTPPTPTEPQLAKLKPGKINKSSPENPSRYGRSSSQTSVRSGTDGSLTHRKSRSSASSSGKTMSMPLSPHMEETKTPGGTLANPSGSSAGFFSSVFSAAQNAASQLSTIANPSGPSSNKSRSSSAEARKFNDSVVVDGQGVVLNDTKSNASVHGSSQTSKMLAVDTLGTGDLTLNQLGISDASSNPSPYASALDFSSSIQGSEMEQTTENRAAARAVSAAYSERPLSEKSLSGDRSKPMEPSAEGQTPPRSQTEPEASIKRSGSIRSKISAGRRRRNRGSSVTTNGTTINHGLASSSATLLNLHSPSIRTRHTGFAAAASKRNREFHQLFKSVPEDDYLIDDYSAALQKEILLHGRIYVSEGHVCFSSNILGWVTNLIISFDEIVSVEKKSTAVIFPNAIIIQTLHARNVFASFLSRDTTYDLIIGIWKSGHPNLKSSLNGITVEGNAASDKTIKADSEDSDGISEEGTEDEVYDEDVEEDESLLQNEASETTLTATDAVLNAQPMSRQASGAGLGINATATSVKLADATEALVAGTLATSDYPGPGTHTPTDCGDSENHLEKLIMDTTIPAPLGKIYSMMFGPSSNNFMRKWLMEEQKCTEVQLDERGLDAELKANNLSYIKPLNGPIGPKQTRCITAQRLDKFDLENAVIVECSTQNPDVPSGNVFVVKTRYCLMWGPANATRLITTCVVEWTGKSWLKGPIEKGANEGQTQYARDLTTALRNAVTKPSRVANSNVKAGKGKSRRRMAESTEQVADGVLLDDVDASSRTAARSYPLQSVVQPILRMLMDTAASTPVAALLALVLISWTLSRLSGFFNRDARFQVDQFGFTRLPSAARIAAYEEMWRTEESDLWSWLEERACIAQVFDGQLADDDNHGDGHGKGRILPRSWDREAQRQFSNDKLDMQQVEEALRVTEERVNALKALVERRKAKEAEKA